jgi:hypothetical protein
VAVPFRVVASLAVFQFFCSPLVACEKGNEFTVDKSIDAFRGVGKEKKKIRANEELCLTEAIELPKSGSGVWLNRLFAKGSDQIHLPGPYVGLVGSHCKLDESNCRRPLPAPVQGTSTESGTAPSDGGPKTGKAAGGITRGPPETGKASTR